MTDEQLAAMHRLLANYHRKLATMGRRVRKGGPQTLRPNVRWVKSGKAQCEHIISA